MDNMTNIIVSHNKKITNSEIKQMEQMKQMVKHVIVEIKEIVP